MKKLITYLLLIFLLADIGYSFMQYFARPLDGDMAAGIVPADDVKTVLSDPFGTSVITDNAVYPNPNRYFSHKAMAEYFQSVPFIFQQFVDPINSIYLANALAKIVIQIAIIVFITIYITGNTKIFNKAFIVIASIITPLFQANGYHDSIGIIDHSITYTFFYALPCALLLFFYFPFFRAAQNNAKLHLSLIQVIIWTIFMVPITLSGPLNPGVILIVSLLYLLNRFIKNGREYNNRPFLNRSFLAVKAIPNTYLYFFTCLSILSLYSLYLGTHNSIFIGEHMPMADRFSRIPQGLFVLIPQKIGYPILLIFLFANAFIIFRYFKNDDAKKILGLFKWVGLFSLLYILLLPLGGYKNYRPYIVRYDTMIPVTIMLVFIYGKSVYFLIQNLHTYKKKIYIACVVAISLLFTLADEPKFNTNACEKEALLTLSNAKEEIVFIPNDCSIMSWDKITDPKASELNAQLFHYWNVTEKKKLYYQSGVANHP